jgi:hypothetical protein
MTPEYLRSLCEWAVADAARVAEEGEWMRRERLLLAEDLMWPAEYSSARSLHVTPSEAAWRRVEESDWPALRLVILHGGDISVVPAMVAGFLRRWPQVTLWAQNLMEEPPADLAGRLRVLPLFEKDRRWCGGAETVEGVVGGERSVDILYPFCGYTNRLRPVWLEQARVLHGRREGLEVIPYPLPREEYEAALADARAVVCPPGNGVDTHRVWETLYKGGWAIVQDSTHTRLLLAEWPTLPLLPVHSAEDLAELVVPAGPTELHPILFRGWWERVFTGI